MSDRPQLSPQTFCDALREAASHHVPDLAERVTAEDVESWVGERWPLPDVAMLSLPAWVRAFLLERLGPGCAACHFHRRFHTGAAPLHRTCIPRF